MSNYKEVAMSKKIIIGLVLITFFWPAGLRAREMRTPLALRQGQTGAAHVPIKNEEDGGYYYGDKKWDYDVWGGAYAQSADQAYGPCDNKKVPIAQIFFDKASFRGQDAFANSTVSNPASPSAPALILSEITPRVDYDEQGVVFGFNATRFFKDENKLAVGIRTRLPYRVIEMRRTDCCGECACDMGALTFNDVCVEESDLFPAGSDPRVTQDSVVNNDWACRLDFVSALCAANCTQPLVTYGDGIVVTGFGTVSDVTQSGDINPDSIATGNPIHLIQIPVGSTPTGLLGAPWNTTVATSPFLNGAGTGSGDGVRTRFDNATDYTPLSTDVAAQSKFWVVPTIVQDGAANNLVLSQDSISIKSLIDQLSKNVATLNPVDFLTKEQGVSFGDEKTRGLSDLDTDLFMGYFFKKNVYLEGELGFRWPTGDKIITPNRLYLIPRGNNGHYEVKLGAMGWWRPKDWFALKADLSLHAALKATERVAASFKGATVKNIGPAVDANVSWNYLIGHFDINFMHPKNTGLGFDLGYEVYVKGHDDICFLAGNCFKKCDSVCDCCNVPAFVGSPNGLAANDFFGISQILDPCVLARNTNVISHKFRSEFFHHWNFCDLFMGWTQVFAGKNAMQETSWYLGMDIRF
jgi:hypothetical protein